MTKTIPFVPYHEALGKILKTKRDVETYLSDALMDEDPRMFLVALKNVVDMNGGMSKLAKDTGLNRVGLYQALSVNGNQEYRTLRSILAWAGVRLSLATAIRSKTSASKKRPARPKASVKETSGAASAR
jgi:probable addiction module antidote protein